MVKKLAFDMRRETSRGSGLLELLLALAVFMSIMPFAYNFAMDHRERAENAVIVGKIKTVQTALEKYVEENRLKFLAPLSANITRVKIGDLKLAEHDEIKDARVQLRVVKSKDSAGRSFVQGIVIFDSPKLTPLRTRQIATNAGASAGFADGQMLYGSFGTWRAPLASIGAAASGHSVLASTRPFKSGGDYIQRLPSENALDATMRSDLDMGGHAVTDVKNISASAARFLDVLDADSIEASKMSVLNRLDWTAPLDIFGDATVMGPITADNRSIDAASVSVTGRSQFRSVTAESLSADNLYLSGFAVSSDATAPSILSISGALDMTKGHIRALTAYIEFSGSVAPKLIVSQKIEDSADSSFYWDFASGDAVLGDLHLSNLTQIIRAVYSAEKTGKTETERLMGGVIMNSNATASDYIRALDQVKKAVAAKYKAVKGLASQ